ncbi:hypothetical protein Raf01_36680 [Rugosimonospora africana]|uniref:Uncharacterized protein n=2 Tax=Rugosimonospora africana TaxID=556532 RepID=A0A8J3QS48_9ACTN|nr:hypothetical protein Raf01_36680 [Rugosimonospora africana]
MVTCPVTPGINDRDESLRTLARATAIEEGVKFWIRNDATGRCLVGDFARAYSVPDCSIWNQYWTAWSAPVSSGVYWYFVN